MNRDDNTAQLLADGLPDPFAAVDPNDPDAARKYREAREELVRRGLWVEEGDSADDMDAGMERFEMFDHELCATHAREQLLAHLATEEEADQHALAAGQISHHELERRRSGRAVLLAYRTAFDRHEIEAARSADAAHRQKHPEDVNRPVPFVHQYDVARLQAREAESRDLGLSDSEHLDREALIKSLRVPVSINEEYSPERIAWYRSAATRLDAWLRTHPGDESIRERRDYLNREAEWIAGELARRARRAAG